MGITLNIDEYNAPVQSQITVRLTRESDGKTWTFHGSNYRTSSSLYFHVDTDGYGSDRNCIIFRPDDIDSYEGVYTVEVEGIRDSSGSRVSDFSYQVNFFDTDSAQDGSLTLNSSSGSGYDYTDDYTDDDTGTDNSNNTHNTTVTAGWRHNAIGWWWQDGDESYPVSTWRWLDGNGDGISE